MSDETMLATCWTTAGDTAPDRADPRSRLSFVERVAAASDAGFRGMGLLSADLAVAEQDHGLAGMAAILADHGITDVELEGIPRWWDRSEPDDVRRLMLRAASELGARHLKITPDDGDAPPPPEQYVVEFSRLAGQAADAGVRLGLEFLPWTTVATLGDGLSLVEAAGHPAGGVVVDLWHVDRVRTPAAELAAVRLDRIVGVELCDAAADVRGTMFEDTVHRRRYCGEGDIDVAGMVRALRSAGWRGPWGVEILSDDHRRLDVASACRRAFDTANAAVDIASS